MGIWLKYRWVGRLRRPRTVKMTMHDTKEGLWLAPDSRFAGFRTMLCLCFVIMILLTYLIDQAI